MTMYYLYTGKRSRSRRYYIRNENGQPVAHFDEIETAATVLRYLQGAEVSEQERNMVHAALIDFDARKEKDKEEE